MVKKITELADKKYMRFLFLALSGILTGLTVCFPVIGLFAWVSLIPAAVVLLRLVKSEKHRFVSIYFYGFFFFMCYFVTSWHWFFSMYPMSFTGLSPVVVLVIILLAVIGIPLVQSVGFAFLFPLAALVGRGRAVRCVPCLLPLAAAALWAVGEWCQNLFWFGVPWARLAISQTKVLPEFQSVSLFGCCFLAFLIVAANFFVADSLFAEDKKRFFAAVGAGIFVFNTVFGGIALLTGRIGERDAREIKAAVIQGNISSTEKWGSDWYERTEGSYISLIEKAAGEGAELVVIPETVFPIYIESSSLLRKTLSDTAKENGLTILVGTMTSDEEDKQRNIIVAVTPDGEIHMENYYSKRHLVPFGEYVPWRDLFTALFPPLADISMLDNDLTPGESSAVFDTGEYKIGSAICFDSIFSSLLRESANDGAEILAIETNDSWFSDSAAVWMHEAQAKLRAVETGRYVLRAANTGVSAIIRADGKVLGEIEPLVDGYLVRDVRIRSDRTLYSAVGDVFVLISALFVVGIFVTDTVIFIRDKKKKGDICQ